MGDQIVLQVLGQVQRDELVAGSRLPPIRELARRLGVNRNTVAQVYKELAEKGYLVTRFGAGSTIRKPLPALPAVMDAHGANGGHGQESTALRGTEDGAADDAATSAPAAPRAFSAAEWEQRLGAALAGSAAAPDLWSRPSADDAINLSALHPYTGLFPAEEFRRCLNTVLRRQGRALLNYGAPMGYLPLRERIAARLTAAGFAVNSAQVLITSGSQQGIDLVARAFLNFGDGVVVESPMYSIARKIFLMHGAALLPYAVGRGGVDLAAIAGRNGGAAPAAAGQRAPKLWYAVPNFQNPTTHSYTPPEKLALLAQVYRTGALLIEDASDEELHPDYAARPPLAALDRAGRVMHLNTFSKTLMPAVRVGYLAGPAPVVRRLSELKEMTDLSHSPIMQAAIVEFMERGLFDTHVRAVRDYYVRRMQRAQGLLAEELPDETPCSAPGGGLCVWVDLPAHVDSLQAQRRLAERGVLVSPGALYQPGGASGPAPRNGLRLCVASESEPRLRQGIKVLGRELRLLLRQQRQPAPVQREYQSIN